MTKHLLDFEPESGLKTWFTYDEDRDSFSLTYEQNVDPVLDANKAAQVDGWDKKADWWHAARIPVGVQYEWLVKHGINLWNPGHKDGVRRLLNDPEYRYLRVNHFIM